MIADIQKGSFAKGIIQYHESKVERGVGELIYNNTLSDTTQEKVSSFLETSELNKRVRSNKFVHFSLSFPEGDQVSNEQFLNIAQDYLQQMGYSDHPCLIYQHDDTAHQHYHIVTTSVSYEGKKVNEYCDHIHNRRLCRSLEEKYGLRPTIYGKKEHTKLSEFNAMRYKVDTGLRQAFKDPAVSLEVREIITAEQQAALTASKHTEEQIRAYLADDKKYDALYTILKREKLLPKLKKEQLIDDLCHVHSVSSSNEEFEMNAKKQGIYVRKLSVKGKPKYVYGLKDASIYLSEKQVPQFLRHDHLFSKSLKVYDKSAAQQKTYLKKFVAAVLEKSVSLNHFENIMKKSHIDVSYATSSKGIYGISFSSLNVTQPEVFKGSELSRELSWNKIHATLSEREQESLKAQKQQETTKQIKKAATKIQAAGKKLDTSQEEQLEEQKRKNIEPEL